MDEVTIDEETMKYHRPKSNASSYSGESEDDEIEKDQALISADSGTLKVRREKRLAMNRASARARRRRKKDLLDILSAQVTDLKHQNQAQQGANETLNARVEQLEAALSQAKTTITAITSSSGAGFSLGQPHGTSGASTINSSNDEARLRSLVLGGLSGGLSGGTSGLGDSFINARVHQYLQQQNQMTNGMGTSGGLGRIYPQLHQQQTSELGSLSGFSNLGSLLGQNFGQGRVSTQDLLSAIELLAISS
jgi:hypothetical protein